MDFKKWMMEIVGLQRSEGLTVSHIWKTASLVLSKLGDLVQANELPLQYFGRYL